MNNFQIGDRVKLKESYGRCFAGEIFTITNIEDDILRVSSNKHKNVAAYDWRFIKIKSLSNTNVFK